MRALLLAVLFLSGCASTTEVTTRTVTDTPPPPAQTLLLVAQTPEGETRETWELVCRPIFERAGLTVLLSHQEVPLWYERGRKALVDWAADHPVDRILMVDLTRLLISGPHMRDRRELNPINQDNEVRPTWRVGLDGERIKDAPPADVEQAFPADLLTGDGANIWHGVARTHEANDQAAIAKSQCLALRDTLQQMRLLP
ncbi:MAG TPA: hypothetical protein VFX91_10025 [Alcanivorax sp.]|nr:hypothetical protein [Alcanivorax sp.]